MHCEDKGKGHWYLCMILSHTNMIFDFNDCPEYKLLFCFDNLSTRMMWEFLQILANCSVELNLKSGHNLHITHKNHKTPQLCYNSPMLSCFAFSPQNLKTLWVAQQYLFCQSNRFFWLIVSLHCEKLKHSKKTFQSVIQMSQIAVACHTSEALIICTILSFKV